MGEGISITSEGIEVRKVLETEVALEQSVIDFLQNKTNLNFVFLNCPFCSDEEVEGELKKIIKDFGFEPIDYRDNSLESISISSICKQETVNPEVLGRVISSFKKPFALRESNCINFLTAIQGQPSCFLDKTLVYYLYKNQHGISKDNFSEQKLSDLKKISEIIDSFDGLIIKQAI